MCLEINKMKKKYISTRKEKDMKEDVADQTGMKRREATHLCPGLDIHLANETRGETDNGRLSRQAQLLASPVGN